MQDLLFPCTFIIYLHRRRSVFPCHRMVGAVVLSKADVPLPYSFPGALQDPTSAEPEIEGLLLPAAFGDLAASAN